MTKEVLVQSDQLFHALIEYSPDAIILLAPDGTLLYANSSVANIAGLTLDELVGMKSFALIYPDDQAKVRAQLASLSRHAGETLTLEYRMRCRDGGWQGMEGTARNLLEDSRVGAIMCNMREWKKREQPSFESLAFNSIPEQTAGVGSVFGHGSERQRGEYQLDDAERKFRSLVESNIVGVMVTDPEGRMYEVNHHLAQMLGYSQEELLNGEILVKDLLRPTYVSARTRAWKTLVFHGSSLPEEKEYVRKDGSTFAALVTAAVLNQERNRALVMLLDNSERKAADRRKEEFMSMVSHELKTPLTIIQGFLELALFCIERISEASSIEASDFLHKLEAMLQQAQQQTELETRLVADLIDVSRIEMQPFAVSLHLHNLVAIVQQVVVNQQQMTSGRCIELILPSQDAISVAVDADRIDQVLMNYLTNAFKYSPADQPVQVEVTVEGSMARVSVRDRGAGLTLEQQQRVWDRFYQTEAAAQQGPEKGLGLGLSIVRIIIAQHQGQVGVESCPGQGATFWFMLPLADEAGQV